MEQSHPTSVRVLKRLLTVLFKMTMRYHFELFTPGSFHPVFYYSTRVGKCIDEDQ